MSERKGYSMPRCSWNVLLSLYDRALKWQDALYVAYGVGGGAAHQGSTGSKKRLENSSHKTLDVFKGLTPKSGPGRRGSACRCRSTSV